VSRSADARPPRELTREQVIGLTRKPFRGTGAKGGDRSTLEGKVLCRCQAGTRRGGTAKPEGRSPDTRSTGPDHRLLRSVAGAGVAVTRSNTPG